ncbi:MAG: hypothetical protein AAGC84_08265, partial [Pseudomonas sp.]
MESPKKYINDAIETLAVGEKVISWASRKFWTRQLLISSVIIIAAVSCTVFLVSRRNAFEDRSTDYDNERALLVKESNDREALGAIQLCIGAEKNADRNQNYYCTSAVNIYKTTFIA